MRYKHTHTDTHTLVKSDVFSLGGRELPERDDNESEEDRRSQEHCYNYGCDGPRPHSPCAHTHTYTHSQERKTFFGGHAVLINQKAQFYLPPHWRPVLYPHSRRWRAALIKLVVWLWCHSAALLQTGCPGCPWLLRWCLKLCLQHKNNKAKYIYIYIACFLEVVFFFFLMRRQVS